jgi:flagellar basal-body rod protein FlgC
MNLFGVLGISASALSAERVRAEVTASNMANAETTRTGDGKLFERQHVVFQTIGGAESELRPAGPLGGSFAASLAAQLAEGGMAAGRGDGLSQGGVTVAGIVTDQSAGLRRYDPGHPDADKDGYVTYPDIDPLTEMVDLMGATRAYGLNVSAVQATKSMIGSSLDILKS